MDTLQRLQLGDLVHLAPELTLIITALVLSLLDLFLPGKWNRNLLGWLSLAGIAISAVFVITNLDPQGEQIVSLLNDSYRVDDFGSLIKLVLLGSAALVVLMSIGYVQKDGIHHVGEFHYLLLPAVLGGMIMASSGDLITLFVGLELLSITSYILVAMKKQQASSTEAGFKYLINGGISSAMILYGMSFLYGMTGTTNIGLMAHQLQAQESFQAMIYLSFFLMLAGFGFKIAAAPFHSWSLDVYQGAPTPVTAFLASVSKAAGFAILFRVLYSVYFGLGTEDVPVSHDIFLTVMVLAAVAMIAGNTIALRQVNMKRLLAASGIANAGYLLVPLGLQFSTMHFTNFSEFYFYLVAYALMNLGAFAVLGIVSQNTGHDDLKGFSGLYYRSPSTAIAMLIFILSLAGIPGTAGFFGKLHILFGTMQMKEYWLAAIMMGTSVISFYYYFGIARQMFIRASSEDDSVRISVPMSIVVWICAGLTVFLGLIPGVLIDYIEDIVTITKEIVIGSIM